MDQIISIPLPDPAVARDPSGRSGRGNRSRLLPFFAGPENRLVEVAVHAVLSDSTGKYNPLILAGESGLGKSHLAHGLAAAYQAQYPRRPVICQPAIDFARAWADAIDGQSTDRFRERYGAARLLILEDLTRLADYASAQRVLVSLVDTAVETAQQVVVTVPTPPGRWVRISPALQSRLEAGLCISLARPNRETRQAILLHAARQRGMQLGEPAARILATGLEGNVRELLGSLAELHAEQQHNSQSIDTDAARGYIERIRAGSTVELSQIAAAVGRVFAIPQGQLRGRSQRQKAVAARAAAMYLARQLTELSLQQIGHYFGGRDHTTVLHHCRKTQKLRETEPTIGEMIEQVEALLHGPCPLARGKVMAGAP